MCFLITRLKGRVGVGGDPNEGKNVPFWDSVRDWAKSACKKSGCDGIVPASEEDYTRAFASRQQWRRG
jgi:hypothetical protein